MKRLIKSLLILFVVCFYSVNVVSAQSSIINTSRSNIKHPTATYTPREGLSLQVKEAELTPPEKKELAGGYFVVYENIVLTEAECKALKAPQGATIKAGKYLLLKKGGAYIVPLRSDK